MIEDRVKHFREMLNSLYEHSIKLIEDNENEYNKGYANAISFIITQFDTMFRGDKLK